MGKQDDKKKPGIDELILLDLMDDEDGGKNSGCLVFILGAGLLAAMPIVLAAVALV